MTIRLIMLLLIPLLVILEIHAQERTSWDNLDGLTGKEFKLIKVPKFRTNRFAFMAMPGVKFQDQGRSVFSNNEILLNSLESNIPLKEFLTENVGPVYKILDNNSSISKKNIVVIFNYKLAAQVGLTKYFALYLAATAGHFSETKNFTLLIPESGETSQGITEPLPLRSGIKLFSIEPGININLNPFNRVVFFTGVGYSILQLKQDDISVDALGRSFVLEQLNRSAKQQLANLKGGLLVRLTNQVAWIMEAVYAIPVNNPDNSRIDRLSGFSGIQFSF